SSSGPKPTGSLAKLGLPQLDEILRETHGIILYQEQVMEIAHKLANFSLAQADILRKAMGGKNPEEMEKMKNIFIQGLKDNKVSGKKADMLYNLILQFAQYGFNKSHSAAYALIAYRTAYLKSHYPVEFMAASLSSDMDNTAKVVAYINECKEMGIKILPPDINQSTREFKVAGNSIRFGLEAVKGVGSSAIDAIIEAGSGKGFDSFFGFCSGVDSRRVNKKVIESLIKAGAMDSMGKRAQLMSALTPVMDAAMRFQKEKNSGQESMFDQHEPTHPQMPDIQEWDDSRRLAMEKEALGFYITGHPLNEYSDKFAELSVTPTSDLQELQDRQVVIIGGIVRNLKQIQTKKGDLMGYVTIEDMYGDVEVIVFPDVYKEAQNTISVDSPVIISGLTDKTDKGFKIIARGIAPIDNTEQIKEITSNSKSFTENKRKKFSQPNTPPKAEETKFKSLMLTMYNNTRTEDLPKLDEILLKYTGDCPVYLKIISPGHWETIMHTSRQVMPSEEMVLDTEHILGKGTARLYY
ncbi:MAG: DNA polymerase III subunit alpha, partial [Thermodesulfovibrionia bacterium]|nr:DNA polymerase III subunit alpha [Thermodesulfovibrionia bacterium]